MKELNRTGKQPRPGTEPRAPPSWIRNQAKEGETEEQYNRGDETTSAIYSEPKEARGKGENESISAAEALSSKKASKGAGALAPKRLELGHF